VTAATTLRARTLTRRHWRATIVLGVFAGIAGGVALGTWGIARRTSNVYDRFVGYENAATMTVMGCTEGVTADEINVNGYQAMCRGYDNADVLELLGSSPLVESAGAFTLGIGWVAPADHPDDGVRQLMPVAIDESVIPALGRSIIVGGRAADPMNASEVTVNEEAADRFGVGVGDRLIVTPYRMDEFELAGEGESPPGGMATTVTVVGITRRPSDLIGRLAGHTIYEDNSAVQLGPAWWQEVGGDVAAYGVGVAVHPAPGVQADDISALVFGRWPDRPFQIDVGPLFGVGGASQATVRDAIRLQAIGMYVIAAVAGLAALVFVGQAVARQSRTEWSDVTILDALGMTRADMARAEALRALALAAVAVLVAGITAIALSPLGPIGIGRAAETAPGVAIDGLVLAVGLPVVAILVIGFATVPVVRLSRRPASERVSGRSAPAPSALSAAGVAGWAMTMSRRAGRLTLGSAVVGVVAGTTIGLAAWALVASYQDLRSDPGAYGSSWDAQVGNVGSVGQQASTRERLTSIPGIDAVGVRSAIGVAEDPQFTLVSGEPFLGDVEFGTITAGRAPTRPTEVALGAVSMRRFGVGIGDEVTITDPTDPTHGATLTVVGEAVINDTMTSRPGVGGLVTDDLLKTLAPQNLSQTYVVWIRPGVDRVATLRAVQQAFPTTFLEHSVPGQVRNLGLVSSQPAWLALIVALLAGAALVHALVTSVRGNRRQIGVLKSLGFTNGQVLSSVAWHASLLTGGALVVGIPLGIVVGRLVWRAVIDTLGVASAPVVTAAAVVGVAALTVMLANLAALAPGWLAARTRAATALRTE
jgi:FtsX-like permease family